MSKPSYRPDIDGLRAIAIAIVILFHSKAKGFDGGYIGVDVFFVISGYLISDWLMGSSGELAKSTIADFYIRRIRRIIPALVIVLAATTLTSIVVLLPLDLIQFGKFLAATPLLITNFVAWDQTGYFDSTIPEKPLIHLWSISVEEQFYLFYPLFFYFISRKTFQIRTIFIVSTMVVSFLLCCWASSAKPSANYYFMPTRIWELLLGALPAIERTRGPTNKILRESISIGALIGIIGTACKFSANTPFPSVYALIPTVSAVALIVLGQERKTLVSKMLSIRPLVFTGMISYSLYLWHFPILAFYRYFRIESPSTIEVVALLIATYCISTLSWQYIESPVRNQTVLKEPKALVTTAFLASIVIILVGSLLQICNGFPGRFNQRIQQISGGSIDRDKDTDKCMSISLHNIETGKLCRYGSPNSKRIVVWGDSHAGALLPAYKNLASSNGYELYFAAESACRPLVGIVSIRAAQWKQASCAQFNDAMLKAIAVINPNIVILDAHWIDKENDLIAVNKLQINGSIFAFGLENTLSAPELTARNICIVFGIPDVKYPVPYALAMAERRNLETSFLRTKRDSAYSEYKEVETKIRSVAERYEASFSDPKSALCTGEYCKIEVDGYSLYQDQSHLTTHGAAFVKNSLESCVSRQDLQ